MVVLYNIKRLLQMILRKDYLLATKFPLVMVDSKAIVAQRDELESLLENFKSNHKPEVASRGCDYRYYGIQRVDDNNVFQKILGDSGVHQMMEDLYGDDWIFFVLYNEISGSIDNTGSGNGLHRDSFYSQWKYIAYLSDVDETSGAFEYVSGTHLFWGKFVDLLKRLGRRNVLRYDLSDQLKLSMIKGSYGDGFFINTSALHRGSPLKVGKARRALTFYFYHKNRIPSSLQQYYS